MLTSLTDQYRMFSAIVLGLFVLSAAAAGNLSSEPIFLQPGCELVFADTETGQTILVADDMFTRSISPYLKAATLKTTRPVSTKEYLDFLKSQVREWTEQEKEIVRRAAEAMYPKLSPYHLRLPKKIVLIKTTGKDMLGCAYCRYASIVFPESMIYPFGDYFESLLTHELFHVYSRYNLEFRSDLYAVLDFKPCREIELPDVIARRVVTNPDAPLNDYYVEIPSRNGDLCVMPILLSQYAAYDPNVPDLGMMAMTDTKLLVLEEKAGQRVCRMENGEPVVLNMADAMGFFTRVGLNTTYVLGVEEVLAENFTLLIERQEPLPSPEIVSKVKDFLLGHQTMSDLDDSLEDEKVTNNNQIPGRL